MRALPAVKTAIILTAGIATGYWASPPILILVGLVSTALVLALVFRRIRSSDVLTLLTLFLSGWLAYPTSLMSERFSSARLEIICEPIEPPYIKSDRTIFPARLHHCASLDAQTLAVKGRIWVVIDSTSTHIEIGSQVRLRGWLQPLRERRNPGDFDYASFRRGKGFIGEFIVPKDNLISRIRNVEIIAQKASLIGLIRRSLYRACMRLGGSDAGLWSGLLLGFRSEMSPQLLDDLRLTGLIHLIALSGLNIGFVAAIFYLIGGALRLSSRRRAVLAVALIWLYCLIVPDRGSTLRAAIMATALAGGMALHKWSHPLNALGLAASIILIYRPGDLFDIGFQLSFAATCGIIIFAPMLDIFYSVHPSIFRRRPAILQRWIILPFSVSLAASLWTLPITSYHYAMLPLGAPLFNLIGVPLIGLIFSGQWLVVLSEPISASAAGLMSDGVSIIITLWKSTCHLFADIAPVWNARFSPLAVLALMAVLLWMAGKYKKGYKVFIFGSLIIAFILIYDGVLRSPAKFQAWFLDVGHGDAAVWIFPNGQAAVIDAGPAPYEGQSSAILKFLERSGRQRIDLLAATHPEADHIGGMSQLIARRDIGLALTIDKSNSTKAYREMLRISQEKKVHWQYGYTGDSLAGLPKGYNIDILHPPRGASIKNDNDASLVLRLAILTKNRTIYLLTCGDIEDFGERLLLKNAYNIESELLKVAHHGSPTSSTPAFIDAVKPQYAVISQANLKERMKFDRRNAVEDRLKKGNITVYNTQDEGAVLFEAGSDGWIKRDWRRRAFWRWLRGAGI
ncbi:MAG: DNA internalization-related competence protein ComEC/Rec2 [Calditrichaeota bacterium]|nr:DNA internalization-related competence protein ComEC/Rec2 [Calditrichota bacterium]